MPDFRGNEDPELTAAIEQLAAGGAVSHTPSRRGCLVRLGDDQAVLVSFTRGRLRIRAYAPKAVKIDFLQLDDEAGQGREKRRRSP